MFKDFGWVRFGGAVLSAATAFLCTPASSYGKTYPTQIEVVTLGGSTFWQGTSITLTPNEHGRYSAGAANSLRRAQGCRDLLTDFQNRPLEVMRANGYITRAVFEELRHKLKDQLNARQLLLVTLFSELPHAEARELFGGEIPESRVIRDWNENGVRRVKISRGTLYAVRGQLEGRPVPVPWELGPQLPRGIERPFDRTKIPALVEIGRAHVESGILGGDFRLAVRTLALTLEKEFYFLGVSPDQVVVTAHFLDPQHVRLFSKRFPFRPLTSVLQAQLEADLKGALARIVDIPLPSTDQWSQFDDTVTVGSMAAFLADFEVEDLSESAYQLRLRTRGAIGGLRALHLIIEFFGDLRDDREYTYPGHAPSRAPLMIRDRGTSLLGGLSHGLFVRYGLGLEGEPTFEGAARYVERLPYNPEPDLFMDPWTDTQYLLRGKDIRSARNDPGIEVTNLDDSLATKYPEAYLASVMISVVDLTVARLQALSPEMKRRAVEWTNQARRKQGLADTDRLDAQSFFEAYGLSFATENPQVEAQLKRMGGKAIQAVATMVRMDGPNSAQFGQYTAYFYEFRWAQFIEIARKYPGFLNDARNRLQSRGHPARLRILQSAYQ